MWRTLMLRLFGQRHHQSGDADAAIAAADLSHERAVEDRCRATAQRAEAEAWAQQIRNHNVANRYDSWLREVMQGESV